MTYIDNLLCSMNDWKISSGDIYDLHLNIVRSSLKGKSVELLPGVDDDIAYNFNLIGCRLIENVVGHYLLFNQDNQVMLAWLETVVSISNKRIRNIICDCINEWVILNL